MKTLTERVNRGDILVGDGAMGSMLMKMATDLPKGICPDSIHLTHPKTVEEITKLYFEAGAQILQTNTFGASPLKLSSYSLEEKTEEINEKAVECVRKVVGKNAYISGSCGPSGKLLKPYGDTEPEEMYDSYNRQLKALVEAGVDVVYIETMTDLQEALLAIKACRSASPSIPIVSSMTFDKTPRGFYTVMGVNIEKAAREFERAGADIIGSNCGNGSENMLLIAMEFSKCSQLPILIQPNAGMPEIRDDVTVYPEAPEYMAQKSRELVTSGVSIIGGCCGTTPDHIRAIRDEVNRI
jgi:5-methyltetrahydrofolate--homocysteine methyltransferase